jgi:hypothetical protein
MMAWTRDHWVALARRMLVALEPYRSPLGARVDLPGPNSRNGAASDGLEGFARTFLLAGFLVAGNGGVDADGWLERYAIGLAAGTDPSSPEAWPRPDQLDQAKVEAASIALILQLTRPWLWDRLSAGVQERVVDWLAGVIGQPYPPINWVWFRIVVESFLREVGGPWSAADIESDLAVHAGMRRSDGWLSDGPERAYDHYVGWALHLYPLLWTHLFDVTGSLVSPGVRAEWAADLTRYLDDAVRLVGADGAPLMQGRSLTYRFAAAAPFWVAALTGCGGLEPGLIRRVTTSMAKYFVTNGAIGPDGILSLGWQGEWPAIRQAYSGPGSPYWACKGMLGLVLPAGHAVWTAPERPLPAEVGNQERAVTAPGWLVSARRADGFAMVLNHGTDHALPGDQRSDSPLYARLGYSTVTMPSSSGWARPLDNTVAVIDAAGRASHRAGFRTLYAEERPGGILLAASTGPVRWVDIDDRSPDHGSGRNGPVTPGPVLTVASVLRGGTEIRLCRVDAAEPDERWRAVRLGGWPLSGNDQPLTASGSAACASVGRLRSELRPLRGFERSGVAVERDVTPLGRWTATPWLATKGPIPFGEVLAAVVVLGRGSPAPSLHVVADQVQLFWPDSHRVTLSLPEFGGAQCP